MNHTSHVRQNVGASFDFAHVLTSVATQKISFDHTLDFRRINLMSISSSLPILESCNNCAACCMRTPIPPFQPGEEAALNVPEELLKPARDRIIADQHFELLPCVWLNVETRLCRHYELRPQACRDFHINSDLCRLSRWDEGVDL